jgi:hypothetical protein
MTTADRVDPIGYRSWSLSGTAAAPSAVVDTGEYVGRHRKPEARRILSLSRMFYTGRHRA